MRHEPPPPPPEDLCDGGVAATLLLGAGRWASPTAAPGAPETDAEAAGGGNRSSAAPMVHTPAVLRALSLWVAPAEGEQCAAHFPIFTCAPVYEYLLHLLQLLCGQLAVGRDSKR